jgi:hypothetical protein
MDQWYYRSTMRKYINDRSKTNFSLVEFPVIRENLKKRSLLTNIRTANTTVIQPLYAISRRDMVFIQKIIQPYNITVKSVELVRITNTLHASIVLKAMQRTIKNATNNKSYCKNSIEIVLKSTSKMSRHLPIR